MILQFLQQKISNIAHNELPQIKVEIQNYPRVIQGNGNLQNTFI